MPTERKNFLNLNINIGGTGLTDKALLAKHLSVMQQSGLTITESLEIIQDAAKGKMKKIIQGVRHSVEAGNSLANSLTRYPKVFSGIFVSAVYAGESSGTLSENLKILAEQLQKEKEITSKVKGALLYPVVVLIAAFIMGLTMSFFVLPKITPLFEGLKTDLPLTTRWLIKFSHLISDHGMALFLSLIGFIVILVWIVKQKFSHPVTHWFMLKVPIVKSIVFHTNLTRFARTLGMLLKSGLHIDEALEVTRNTVGNYYYYKALSHIEERVAKGTKLADNLKAYPNLFPRMVSRMIMVGEESGNLEDTLAYLANFYEVEVDNSTKSLATAVEPILLIFIGLVVGFLALSIITPIYNITGGINR